MLPLIINSKVFFLILVIAKLRVILGLTKKEAGSKEKEKGGQNRKNRKQQLGNQIRKSRKPAATHVKNLNRSYLADRKQTYKIIWRSFKKRKNI